MRIERRISKGTVSAEKLVTEYIDTMMHSCLSYGAGKAHLIKECPDREKWQKEFMVRYKEKKWVPGLFSEQQLEAYAE